MYLCEQFLVASESGSQGSDRSLSIILLLRYIRQVHRTNTASHARLISSTPPTSRPGSAGSAKGLRREPTAAASLERWTDPIAALDALGNAQQAKAVQAAIATRALMESMRHAARQRASQASVMRKSSFATSGARSEKSSEAVGKHSTASHAFHYGPATMSCKSLHRWKHKMAPHTLEDGPELWAAQQPPLPMADTVVYGSNFHSASCKSLHTWKHQMAPPPRALDDYSYGYG